MSELMRPDGMNIELTNSCPLRCPQCYCTLEGGKHIPLETALRVLEQAAALGVRHVELSGGETLCYPHLYEVVEAASRLNIAPSISVSGWHFTDEVLHRLIESGIDTIYVSLNGPTKTANSLTRDGFELGIGALEVLQRNAFPNTVINWVMHRETADLLPDMISLAERYDVSGILIIDPKPTAAGEMNTYPSKEQLYRTAELVKKQRGKQPELIVQHCFSPLLALSKDNPFWGNLNRGPYRGCTAGIISFSVNVDGLFSPCRHLDFFEKWDSLSDYWERSPVLERIRTLDEGKQEPCRSCRYSPYCRHCLAVNAAEAQELYLGNVHCSLWKSSE